jgi:glycerol uptake facilitator-like aquaporin
MLQRPLAEFLGTALIVATVIGAGFMTANLSADPALALAMIAVAAASVLFVAITIFGPVSGSHFNPVVTLGLLVQGRVSPSEAIFYIFAQCAGGISGALMAGAMFQADISLSTISRHNPGSFLGEVVATAGLVLLVLLLVEQNRGQFVAGGVALWILAGHLFTSSTSFANPAVTLGRVFSSSQSSISFESAIWFSLAQVIGLAFALVILFLLQGKVRQ